MGIDFDRFAFKELASLLGTITGFDSLKVNRSQSSGAVPALILTLSHGGAVYRYRFTESTQGLYPYINRALKIEYRHPNSRHYKEIYRVTILSSIPRLIRVHCLNSARP